MAAATADAAGIYNGAKVGDWTPPNPPAKEIAHLAHLNLKVGEKPRPHFTLAAARSSRGRERRYHLMGATVGVTADPQRVPHNWFGTGKFSALGTPSRRGRRNAAYANI